MLRTSTDSDNAEERAREIHTDLNLIIQSEQKELCFLAFQLLLDTKHVDLLLNVRYDVLADIPITRRLQFLTSCINDLNASRSTRRQ